MMRIAMSRRPRLAAPGLLLAAALAGASPRPAVAEVVARAGATELGSEELRGYLEALEPADQAALAKDPALLAQVVRTHLARQAVVREAQAKKWDQRPEVKAQLERVRERALGELYLLALSKPPDGYPGEAELQAAYDANRQAFEVPAQLRLAQVFLALPRGADKVQEEQVRKRLDEVKRLLAAKGADFAAIARAHSDEKEGAARGGEIGWLGEAQLVPAMRPVVAALAKDGVSEPVRLDDGWHVTKLLDQRKASVRPLAEVREALVARLRADRLQANRQAVLAKLLEQSPPVLNELALQKLVAKGR